MSRHLIDEPETILRRLSVTTSKINPARPLQRKGADDHLMHLIRHNRRRNISLFRNIIRCSRHFRFAMSRNRWSGGECGDYWDECNKHDRAQGGSSKVKPWRDPLPKWVHSGRFEDPTGYRQNIFCGTFGRDELTLKFLRLYWEPLKLYFSKHFNGC